MEFNATFEEEGRSFGADFESPDLSFPSDFGKLIRGADGYTPIKGIDYFDGKDGRDGVNGAPGKDGYTPIKGIDYFDGLPGKDGAPGKDGSNGRDGRDGIDGYTPIKGVDYFDGLPGKDGSDGKDGYTPIKGIDYFDGEQGIPGINGKDGKTPVKGVDYYTPEEVAEIKREVTPQKGVDYFDGYTPIKGVDYFDGEKGEPGTPGVSTWGGISGSLSNQIDLSNALNDKISKSTTANQTILSPLYVGDANSTVGNAFTHVRKVVPKDSYYADRTVTGAAFAVSFDGTAAFQHKSLDDNGGNGRNEAVLRFYPNHIQFATNSTSAKTPAEEDYKDLAFAEDILTEEDVNKLIDAKIGVIENGSY